MIYALAHVCGQDRTLLASILLRAFRHETVEAPLLRTLNDREISMEGEGRGAGGEAGSGESGLGGEELKQGNVGC